MNETTNAIFITLHAAAAPEWIHLLPASGSTGVDGRGPYHYADAQAIISASMKPGKLVVDENHSTDLAAKEGHPAPARGWITQMQARADGIWGRVEWTDSGKTLMADAAYRGISPVFLSTKEGVVTRILRASLTNEPNLPLKTLHAKETVMDLTTLAKAAGLAETADLAAITAKVTELHSKAADADKTVARLAKAAGADEQADVAKLEVHLQAQAVKAVAGGNADEMSKTVVSLQTQLKEMQTQAAQKEAERFVDQAIMDGKPIKSQRDAYIKLHMADVKGTEKLVNDLPSLHAGGLNHMLTRQTTSLVSPDAPQTEIHAAAVKYANERKAAGEEISHSQAVRFVTGT